NCRFRVLIHAVGIGLLCWFMAHAQPIAQVRHWVVIHTGHLVVHVLPETQERPAGRHLNWLGGASLRTLLGAIFGSGHVGRNRVGILRRLHLGWDGRYR